MNPIPRAALVTGAARRIGAAIARRLHADGYGIALHYRNSASEAEALAAELNALRPGSVLLLQADLSQIECLPALVEAAVRHFGRLDVLVNNASGYYSTPLGSITAQQWDELFNANARAPLFLAQAAAPHLRASGGCIVNLTDLYAQHPTAELAVHAASKAALASLTQSLALALAPDVRVNAIAPGAIEWPEHAGSGEAALGERAQRILQATPLARKGSVDDIADAVAWLVDSAGFVTGQVIRIDGGRGIAG